MNDTNGNGHTDGDALHNVNALLDRARTLTGKADVAELRAVLRDLDGLRQLLTPEERLPTEWPEVERTPQPTTVRQVAELYLAMGTSTLAPRNVVGIRSTFGRFVADLGDLKLSKCKPLDLLNWLTQHTEYKSDWTKSRVVRTVARAFAWCKQMGAIRENPFAGLSHPTGERGRPMEADEYQTILRNTDPLFRRVIVWLRFSGCRPGEMSALKWEDVDLERGCCVLMRHKTAKKTRKPRTIVLAPALIKMLVWMWRHFRPLSPYVFLNERGNPWTRPALALRMMRLRDRTGLPKSCKMYGLRHCYGTEAIKAGVDLVSVSELMGHASTKMTEYYLHVGRDMTHLRVAAAKAMAPKRA